MTRPLTTDMQKPLHSPQLALGVDITVGRWDQVTVQLQRVVRQCHLVATCSSHSFSALAVSRAPRGNMGPMNHPVRSTEPWVVVFQLPLCLTFVSSNRSLALKSSPCNCLVLCVSAVDHGE